MLLRSHCLVHSRCRAPSALRRPLCPAGVMFGGFVGVSLQPARAEPFPRIVLVPLFQVSTPLALNIYTAVHNPISVKGRLQLCKGALAHVDTRPVLSEIDIPVVCIQSTQNNFVKPLHTDPYVSRRGGEVRSIHKASAHPERTCCLRGNRLVCNSRDSSSTETPALSALFGR